MTGFSVVPLQLFTLCGFVVAAGGRAYFQNDKSGFSVDHKPELNVIAFPSDKVKTHVQEEKSGTGEQSHTTIILKNPFKDYATVWSAMEATARLLFQRSVHVD